MQFFGLDLQIDFLLNELFILVWCPVFWCQIKFQLVIFMYVKELSIENYKCFWVESVIKLVPGFNIFIGANNSGKTTAMNALLASASIGEPHRSIVNIINPGDVNVKPSVIRTSFSISREKLFELATRLDKTRITLPAPSNIQQSPENSVKFWRAFLSKSDFIIKRIVTNDGCHFSMDCGLGDSYPFSYSNPALPRPLFTVSLKDGEWSEPQLFTGDLTNHSLKFIYDEFNELTYKFDALRKPDAFGSFTSPVLNSNSSNLPFCLNFFQTNDSHAYKNFCSLINRVFPGVKWIQATPDAGGNFTIYCLPCEPEAGRSDLQISLDKMGSGIGSVIAMLYIAISSRLPRVIVIDEPNTFLHPRALREFLCILKEHGGHHQYILSGHSADVINSIDPAAISCFELNNSISNVKNVPGSSYKEVRSELSELGIRMTELHGRDRVLWVEGETEEIVIPRLIERFIPAYYAGTAVLKVHTTGIFSSKKIKPNEVAAIYEKLSRSASLAPPMVAILLDREMNSLEQCEKLKCDSRGRLQFLKYRMLENYVLNPLLISMVLADLGVVVEVSDIENSLNELKNESLGDDMQDGAAILRIIFDEFSNSTREFRKTIHVPMLFDLAINVNPDLIVGLIEELSEIFNQRLQVD